MKFKNEIKSIIDYVKHSPSIKFGDVLIAIAIACAITATLDALNKAKSSINSDIEVISAVNLRSALNYGALKKYTVIISSGPEDNSLVINKESKKKFKDIAPKFNFTQDELITSSFKVNKFEDKEIRLSLDLKHKAYEGVDLKEGELNKFNNYYVVSDYSHVSALPMRNGCFAGLSDLGTDLIVPDSVLSLKDDKEYYLVEIRDLGIHQKRKIRNAIIGYWATTKDEMEEMFPEESIDSMSFVNAYE